MRILFLFLTIALVLFAVYMYAPSFLNPPTYTYFDGNGNTYIVQKNSLEYIPRSLETSSSGIYDGGESVKKEITSSQYEEIKNVVEKAIANTESHIENREMKSGIIRVKQGEQEQLIILAPGSEEQRNIEEILVPIK